MSPAGIDAFKELCGASLFPGSYPLFAHQQKMLKESLQGQNCIVTTGTGSGKTEAFLLPMLASIVREMAEWSPVSNFPNPGSTWLKENGQNWNSDKRSECWGETREPAIRGLLLYPMNALVEDQLSRLRETLDSDVAHAACRKADSYMQGNRITFGRFNGETPVSGHPFNSDGRRNGSARDRLSKAMSDQTETYNQLLDTYKNAQGESRKTVAELLNFFPRLDDCSSEMVHRWDMQRRPPDIFITNFSMLSIMLMRHRDPAITGDQADGDMIDKTREWLEGDPCRHDSTIKPTRVFHMVVDELHLYRGTAGTEVAYLIRLLLHRLGLSPGDQQLRILASSASMDSDSPDTWDYIGEFFGYESGEAKDQFKVIGGKQDFSEGALSPGLPKHLVEACSNASAEPKEVNQEVSAALESSDNIGECLVAACKPDPKSPPRAVSLEDFSERLFPSVDTAKRPALLSPFLRAIAESKKAKLPRFRFHWMARAVEGIWASADPSTAQVKSSNDPYRTVGKLVDEAGRFLDEEGNRILEVLYCDCCGILFTAGRRCEVSGQATPLPGQPGASGVELLPVSPDLEKLPGGFSESLTDRLGSDEIAVFWPLPPGIELPSYVQNRWEQAKLDALESEDGMGWKVGASGRVEAQWKHASMNPKTAIVTPTGSDNSIPSGHLEGYYFDLAERNDDCFGLPHICPNCGSDYGKRYQRLSPVRTFRTGLNKLTQVLSKQLFRSLMEAESEENSENESNPSTKKSSPKLVSFSDSREAAAILANGVESEHWSDVLRSVFFGELLRHATESPADIQREFLKRWEAGGEDLSNVEQIATDLFDEKQLSDTLGEALGEVTELVQKAEVDLESVPSFKKAAAERKKNQG